MTNNQHRISDLKVNYYVVWSEIVKNLKFLSAYPSVFIFWGFFPILWFIPFIFQGQAFVGGLQSASFEKLAGTSEYIPFILIGAILNSYVLASVYGVGESMRKEAYQGTLDHLLSSPCNKAFILIGKALGETMISTLFAVDQILVSVLFFGLKIALEAIMPVLLIIILLILSSHGISIMVAAISLQYKQAYDITHSMEYIFYVFAPVRYPIQSLPLWAQAVSRLLPLTYALVAVRSLTLMNKSLATLYTEILFLFIISVVTVSVGFYLFNWMERKTKSSGTISHF